MLKCFVRDKNTANSPAIIAEQRLDPKKTAYTTYTLTASEDDVPRASLHTRTLTVHKLKVLLWYHDHHMQSHPQILITGTQKYKSLQNYRHVHNQAVHEKKG